jgi:Family of unknown function (DUF6632)
MTRARALKVLLTLVGVALLWCVYPLVTSLLNGVKSTVSPGDQMILGIYFPIGLFMLLAVRDPSANRSLIICFAWSTLAHDSVMVIQAIQGGSVREDWPGQAVIGLVCVLLLALVPPKAVTRSSPDAATARA